MITNEEIKKNLNNLRIIGPNPEFKKSSRALILKHEAEKAPFSGMLFLRFAGAFAVLILVIAALTFELTPTPVLSSSFNPDYLQNEIETLTVSVQIKEAEYRAEANQTIASALNEIENTEVKHLNNSLLESEVKDIEIKDSTNSEIDALLNEMIL